MGAPREEEVGGDCQRLSKVGNQVGAWSHAGLGLAHGGRGYPDSVGDLTFGEASQMASLGEARRVEAPAIWPGGGVRVGSPISVSCSGLFLFIAGLRPDWLGFENSRFIWSLGH